MSTDLRELLEYITNSGTFKLAVVVYAIIALLVIAAVIAIFIVVFRTFMKLRK